jgi:hypothetical protein
LSKKVRRLGQPIGTLFGLSNQRILRAAWQDFVADFAQEVIQEQLPLSGWRLGGEGQVAHATS